MNSFVYFWLFCKASLFSTGGIGNLPSLHADLVARHWATQRQFAESLTIGQVAPGPTGFWVISLGYLTHGITGSTLAAIAIVLPPLLILVIDRIYRRMQDHPAVEGFVRGLTLSVAGISVVVLAQLFQTTGVNVTSIGIAIIATALALTRRIPLVAILAMAGVTGVLLK